jgi:putative transposase
LAQDPRCPAGTDAKESRQRTHPFGRYPGQPNRQDDGKRGICGYDAGKKIKGRKRHIVVDTLGLVLAAFVHGADVQDRDGARWVLAMLLGCFPRLKLIWADGSYAGGLVDWVARVGGWALQIVKRSDDLKRFVVLPKRWIVERTFAWLGRCRRLSKDYEQNTQSSQTMIYLAMINLMVHRLAPG